MKNKTTQKKPTAAQISKAKDDLYDSVMKALEQDADLADDVTALQEYLVDGSLPFEYAVQKVIAIHAMTTEAKEIKAFKVSSQDFKKIQQEVEDSCLSDEGKAAILKAMGV